MPTVDQLDQPLDSLYLEPVPIAVQQAAAAAATNPAPPRLGMPDLAYDLAVQLDAAASHGLGSALDTDNGGVAYELAMATSGKGGNKDLRAQKTMSIGALPIMDLPQHQQQLGPIGEDEEEVNNRTVSGKVGCAM